MGQSNYLLRETRRGNNLISIQRRIKLLNERHVTLDSLPASSTNTFDVVAFARNAPVKLHLQAEIHVANSDFVALSERSRQGQRTDEQSKTLESLKEGSLSWKISLKEQRDLKRSQKARENGKKKISAILDTNPELRETLNLVAFWPNACDRGTAVATQKINNRYCCERIGLSR